MRKIDPSKPTWVLFESRPYGPFRVHTVGVDHAALIVPKDKRMWVNADRAKPNGDYIMTWPLAIITQDEAEVKSWWDRNEPKVGDLVAVSRSGGRDIVVGVVGKTLNHQLQLVATPAGQDWHYLTSDRSVWKGSKKTPSGLGSHVSKDACFVLARSEDPDEVGLDGFD